jgi:hypothetical protein
VPQARDAFQIPRRVASRCSLVRDSHVFPSHRHVFSSHHRRHLAQRPPQRSRRFVSPVFSDRCLESQVRSTQGHRRKTGRVPREPWMLIPPCAPARRQPSTVEPGASAGLSSQMLGGSGSGGSGVGFGPGLGGDGSGIGGCGPGPGLGRGGTRASMVLPHGAQARCSSGPCNLDRQIGLMTLT